MCLHIFLENATLAVHKVYSKELKEKSIFKRLDALCFQIKIRRQKGPVAVRATGKAAQMSEVRKCYKEMEMFVLRGLFW